MFRNGLLTSMLCLVVFHARATSAKCWSDNACIDATTCAVRGGSSQAGLCSGASHIRCCTCNNCMDVAACEASGGTSHSGICPGSANMRCCVKGSNPSGIGSSKPVNRMLTDLADILRKAGLNVVEEPGWKTRGHGVMASVKVRDGRPDLSGPLSQLGLGRSGTWYVIAAGRSYHAGATIDDSIFGNSNSIGIEAEATGTPADNVGHKHWPEVQWESYVRGVKALQAAYGVLTSRVLGHKEAAVPAGRKPDPNFSMNEFRAALG
ncbi:unnamed protein product [Rotaria sordida]|uniref:N-acetylmuramoyl-L-alanine amidase domain-containing protein n=1 Tax=Rotaria sordida TaxID=392033 RepID=A0A814E3J2_9BILA|nr:unnamed protein product [Rotaria sordida]